MIEFIPAMTIRTVFKLYLCVARGDRNSSGNASVVRLPRTHRTGVMNDSEAHGWDDE